MKKMTSIALLILLFTLSSCTKAKEPDNDAYGVPYDPVNVDLLEVTESHKTINEGKITITEYTDEDNINTYAFLFVEGYLYQNSNGFDVFTKSHGEILEVIQKDVSDNYVQLYQYKQQDAVYYSDFFFNNWSGFDLSNQTIVDDYIVLQNNIYEGLTISIRINSKNEIDHVKYFNNNKILREIVYEETNTSTIQIPSYEPLNYLDYLRERLLDNGITIQLREATSTFTFKNFSGELDMNTYQIKWIFEDKEIISGSKSKIVLSLQTITIVNPSTMELDLITDMNEINAALDDYGIYDATVSLHDMAARHYHYVQSDLNPENN